MPIPLYALLAVIIFCLVALLLTAQPVPSFARGTAPSGYGEEYAHGQAHNTR